MSQLDLPPLPSPLIETICNWDIFVKIYPSLPLLQLGPKHFLICFSNCDFNKKKPSIRQNAILFDPPCNLTKWDMNKLETEVFSYIFTSNIKLKSTENWKFFNWELKKMLYPPSHKYLVPIKFIFWIRFFPDPPPLFEQMSENLQCFFFDGVP